jgi:hypothetical protein
MPLSLRLCGKRKKEKEWNNERETYEITAETSVAHSHAEYPCVCGFAVTVQKCYGLEIDALD